MEKEHEFLDLVVKGHLPPTPGLQHFVARCAERGLGLAIASAAPRENVETVSREFGLQEAVRVRLSMDDVERAKPAPDLFLEAARRLGVAPAECVVFEDSLHGLEAGRRAGCRTIGILTLHDPEELRELADLTVTDFAALLRLEEWRTL
jgi:HAD superfamily hydrolase (TIGR01509 family)